MRKLMLASAVAAVVMGGVAFATSQANREERPVKERIGELVDANTPAARAEARFEAKLAAQTARETATLDVGDPDSFGRNVRWLGYVSSPLITLRENCELLPGEDPARLCLQTSTTDPFRTGWARFDDVARMTLPARSMNSMLCHWMSPTVVATFRNNAGNNGLNGRVTVSPSLTLENEALNDPSLVDPETGEPLNGKLQVYASSAAITALMDAGQSTQQRQTSTRTCVGGYINRRALVEVYGMSPRQAEAFFSKPTVVRLNLEVFTSLVQNGGVAMAIRFVGD